MDGAACLDNRLRVCDTVRPSGSAALWEHPGLHGAGSPVKEDIAIPGTNDIASKKELAMQLAGTS